MLGMQAQDVLVYNGRLRSHCPSLHASKHADSASQGEPTVWRLAGQGRQEMLSAAMLLTAR